MTDYYPRLLYPDAASVDRVQATAGLPLLSSGNATARVYVDSAGTELADILNVDGSPNPTATLTLDNESRLPEFYGPTSGVEKLWVRIDGGVPLAVYGQITARLAAIRTEFAAADAAAAAYDAAHYVPISVRKPLAADQRGAVFGGPAWSADHVFPYFGSIVDGVFFIDGIADAGGSNSPVTYTKMFGGYGTKTGAGNLDCFWASLHHHGPGEAGLFIGDLTSHEGGNLYGGHFFVKEMTVPANLTGLLIELVKTVPGTAKTQIGLEVGNTGTSRATQGIVIHGGGGFVDAFTVRDAESDLPIFNVTGAAQGNSVVRVYNRLEVGSGGVSSFALEGATDIARMFGGGTVGGLLVYTSPGPTGTAGIFQVRDNRTDDAVYLGLEGTDPFDSVFSVIGDQHIGSTLKLTGKTDAARIYGGGAGLLLYGTTGGAGTSGVVQIRNNNADETVKLQVATGALAAGTTNVTLTVNDGAITSFRNVSIGAVDSGGAGYRTLRVPN